MSKSKLPAAIRGLVLGMLAATVSACTSSETTPLQSSVSEKPIVAQQPLATGVPEMPRLRGKGGTKIAVLVNKRPITSNQIRRRAAFVKLRNMKGNRTKIATEELIEESIKMQEARRIRAVASEQDVATAYATFARNNKMPPQALTQILNKRGVTERGFKDYIRASISWRRAVAGRLRAEARGTASGQKVPTQPSWLPKAGTDANRENEYTIQQIVFSVPRAQRGSLMARRRSEAKNFRTRLNGCTNGRELAKGLKNVAVLDRGRLLESRLPPRWVKQVKSTPAGKVTRVQDSDQGVELIAVCKTREVISNAKVVDSKLFDGKNFQQAAGKLNKSYYAELKERAVIDYR